MERGGRGKSERGRWEGGGGGRREEEGEGEGGAKKEGGAWLKLDMRYAVD